VVGLVVGLEVRPAAIDLPHRLVSQGLAHTASRLALGLAAGLAGGLGGGIAGGLGGGIAGGLVFGLVIGLAFVSNSPWPRYAVACLLLARRRAQRHSWIGPTTWVWCGCQVSRCSSDTENSRPGSLPTGKELKFPKPPSPAGPEPLDQADK
jgi:hypothetical protein